MASPGINRLPCRRSEIAPVDPANYRIPIPTEYPKFGADHWHSVLENTAPLFPDRRPMAVRRDVTTRRQLLCLAQFVLRLGQHEPALVRLILGFLRPYHRSVPILVPLTELFGSPFAQLRTAVATLRPGSFSKGPIRERVTALALALPEDALAAVRRVVMPDPNMVSIHLELIYNGPAPSTWSSVLLNVPADTYPLPLRWKHHLHIHGLPQTDKQIAEYWASAESRQRGHVIKGFETMFPRDAARLLYGAAVMAEQPDPLADDVWPRVQQAMRAFNKILKTHS